MTHYYIAAGQTVAGTFNTHAAALKSLKQFSVGIGVTIKKGRREAPQERNTSKVLRGKIGYLKPGDFTLPV